MCIFLHSDFLWLNDSVLLSCSKDGKLIQQLFSEAEKPIERAVSDFCCICLQLHVLLYTGRDSCGQFKLSMR